MAPKPRKHAVHTASADNDAATCAGERVVISGMAGLYPNALNVKEFSDILYNKVNPVTADDSRWKYNHPEVRHHTGKLPDLQTFDAQFFKVHYRLANNMDPMGRKILEQAYQAIYDAGISPEHLSGKKVGVYIGTCFSETEKACFYVAKSRTGFGIAGCSKTMFANRISYWLNAKGPSMSVDEACCSSMAAVELAYQAIMQGECEAAIVGGTYLCLHPQSSIHYGRIMKLSEDGKTRSYDENADGCAKSEAINVLFLQKAKDALRIYAEIVYIKNEFTKLLNNEEGPRYGFYRKTEDSVKFLKEFYAKTPVSPLEVEYVEGCGSAVPEVDKVELETFEEIFCKGREDPLMIGSVMSNVGYGEAASGITAITKVLLGYRSGWLAGNLHAAAPRRDVAALRDGRLRVLRDHAPFRRRYAAVNQLSITGVNAHVLLKGHFKPKDISRYSSTIPHLVLISGRQESAVNKILDDLESRPVDPEELALLNNIHETTITGNLARGFVVLGKNENGETVQLSKKADYFDYVKRPLWFVYSGMGSQWAGMGKHLMRIPTFAAAIHRCHRVLETKGVNLVEIITTSDKNIFDNILHSFIGITAIQIGLTDVLLELGLVPDKIIGHSLGEMGCAYADGCLTAEEAILCSFGRGLVSVQTPFVRGAMAAVGIGYQQIIGMCPPEIEVACHNSHNSCTISGPEADMAEFIKLLTSKNIYVKEVPCSNIAYHSRYIANAGPGLLKILKSVIKSPKLRSKRWVSTSVPMDKWDKDSARYSSAEYHTNNLLSPVLFEEASRLVPADAVLVELAPHALLQAILKRSLPASCRNVPLTRRAHPDSVLYLLEAIGTLYVEGFNPIIKNLYPKIEFPVSTETPMLSHLVEWAHGEKWHLPLYLSARRKTAAAATYAITLHDDEHAYLRGHVVHGRSVVPLAAALVAAWDTLGMARGSGKRAAGVRLSDVRLRAPPALHARRALRLAVALHRGTGKFEVLDDLDSKIASGYINEVEDHKDALVPDSEVKSDETDDMNITSEEIYNCFNLNDVCYKDSFRSIHSANSSLTKARILWRDNWVTFLDGLIQLNALRHSQDSYSQINAIGTLIIDPAEHIRCKDTIMTATVLETHDLTRCGGVTMQNVKYHTVPVPAINSLVLRDQTYVPHFGFNHSNIESVFQVYMKIVTKNLDKRDIEVLGILDSGTELQPFHLTNILNAIPEARTLCNWQTRERVLEDCNLEIFSNVDVLVCNMSTGDQMYELLSRGLLENSYIINILKPVEKDMPSNALYQVVCRHTVGSLCVELARWRPTNRIDEGVLGGVYYVPIAAADEAGDRKEFYLDGKLDSLEWVQEAPHTSEEGLEVEVHYVGLNDLDVKRSTGLIPPDTCNDGTIFKGYGMDFSGVTKSGMRVMGLVQCGAARSHVTACPRLLWPVPLHWSLEDAATVPLAYCLAYYCLACTTNQFQLNPDIRIMVHGGAGGFGQAVISIALSYGCVVFTTVSDIYQKRFLLKLFPTLKAENIGSSGDLSFRDEVLNATNGEGVDIMLIDNLNTELKSGYMTCLKHFGTCIDVSQIPNRENFNLGLNFLTKEKTYKVIDFLSIFKQNRYSTMKKLQRLMAEGIARGAVVPQPRAALPGRDAARGLRLAAAARLLLHLHETPLQAQPTLQCSADRCHVIISDHQCFGQQLANTLVSRGARKLCLCLPLSSKYLQLNLRQWQDVGVQVRYEMLSNTKDIQKLISNNELPGPVEGVYIYIADKQSASHLLLDNLDNMSRKSLPDLKYFAVISTSTDEKSSVSGVNNSIITTIRIPKFKDISTTMDRLDSGDGCLLSAAVRGAERALAAACAAPQLRPAPPPALLHQLAALADIKITENNITDDTTTLSELGVTESKLNRVFAYLRDTYNVHLTREQIQNLTIQRVNFIEETLTKTGFDDVTGLKALFSSVTSDELNATTDIVFLPTLTSANLRDDEYDMTETFLCIVPGVEGQPLRFSTLSARLKLPALLLQPPLNRPDDTPQQLARRFTEILLQKARLKNKFYLLGYEMGVFVALEMAAILEENGLTGTVFCIGTPDEITAEVRNHLESFQTDEALQEAIVLHMFGLMTKGACSAQLEAALRAARSWAERVEAGVRGLRGRVPHSAQFTQLVMRAAYGRVRQLLRPPCVARPRARCVLLRPRASRTSRTSRTGRTRQAAYAAEYALDAPLALAADDLRCAAVINAYLDADILQAFDNRNLCETYLTNAETFMMPS